MDRLTAYPPKPMLSSNTLTSPTPYLKPNDDHETLPLTRPSSPTPSEKEELKEFDGIIVRAFRKKSWKDKGFLSEYLSYRLALTDS